MDFPGCNLGDLNCLGHFMDSNRVTSWDIKFLLDARSPRIEGFRRELSIAQIL